MMPRKSAENLPKIGRKKSSMQIRPRAIFAIIQNHLATTSASTAKGEGGDSGAEGLDFVQFLDYLHKIDPDKELKVALRAGYNREEVAILKKFYLEAIQGGGGEGENR